MYLQVKLPNLNDSASEDLERLLKEVTECEGFDEMDSSTKQTSQPSLVEESMITSRDVGKTFAESPASEPVRYLSTLFIIYQLSDLGYFSFITVEIFCKIVVKNKSNIIL